MIWFSRKTFFFSLKAGKRFHLFSLRLSLNEWISRRTLEIVCLQLAVVLAWRARLLCVCLTLSGWLLFLWWFQTNWMASSFLSFWFSPLSCIYILIKQTIRRNVAVWFVVPNALRSFQVKILLVIERALQRVSLSWIMCMWVGTGLFTATRWCNACVNNLLVVRDSQHTTIQRNVVATRPTVDAFFIYFHSYFCLNWTVSINWEAHGPSRVHHDGDVNTGKSCQTGSDLKARSRENAKQKKSLIKFAKAPCGVLENYSLRN